jgi:hypothetical protein
MFAGRKCPFAVHEDPAAHMIALLSAEAESGGTPFSDEEKAVLAAKHTSPESVPENLRGRTKRLIEILLRKEEAAPAPADPRSFGNSLEWAGVTTYPNIVALTEQVVTSGGASRGLPRLHGMKWVKERLQLLGCAFAVVLFMLLLVGILEIVFPRK